MAKKLNNGRPRRPAARFEDMVVSGGIKILPAYGLRPATAQVICDAFQRMEPGLQPDKRIGRGWKR